ncbi:MAG: hypothetical protein ACR2PQ_02625 [Myxococcota bacterium]
MRPALLGLCALAGLACFGSTDRASYTPGEAGTSSFHNESETPISLEGCSAYHFEQRFESGWRDAGPAVVCVWEGFARTVDAGESLSLPLVAPNTPGTWRLRYTAALGCAPDLPLSQADCEITGPVYTPAFQVRALCAPSACGPPLGMPNRLCPDGEAIAGPTGRCLRDPEYGSCGWEIAECPRQRSRLTDVL